MTGHGVISFTRHRGVHSSRWMIHFPLAPPSELEFSLSDWPVSIRARVVYLVGNDAGALGRPRGVGVVFLDRDRETGDRIFEEIEKRSARYTP